MADTKADIRTIQAVTPVAKTSLVDFLSVGNTNGNHASTTEPGIVSGNAETSESDTSGSRTKDDGDATISASEMGDASTTVPGEDTYYEVKGKKVTVKDLLNAFETREEISRRFDAVGKQEQRNQAEREKIKKEKEEIAFINEKFEEMREQVLAGNSLGALQIAATMAAAGAESTDSGIEALIKQAVTISENFANMTEEEQQLFLKKEKLAHQERTITKKEAKQKEKEEEEALRTYYNDILVANNVNEVELDEAFNDIQRLPEYKAALDKMERKERISYCVSWTLGKRINKTIEEGIKKVSPALAADQTFRLALLDHVDPKCTVDDVASITKAFLEGQSKDSAKGESAASTQGVAPTKPTTPNRAPTEKPAAEKRDVPITSWKDMIAKHSH